MTPDILTIDPDRRMVSFDGKQIRLTNQEFCVLEYLVARPGMIRSRAQIMDAAFEGGGYGVEDRAVDTTIKRLRRHGIPGIQTYHYIGYFWEPVPKTFRRIEGPTKARIKKPRIEP